MRFCLYDPVSGEILGLMESPVVEHVEAQGLPYLSAGEDVSDEIHFVDLSSTPPSIVNKQVLDVGTSVTGSSVTLTGLPDGTLVSTEGLEGFPDNGELEIEFDIPGVYRIELFPPPQYLGTSLEVTIG